MVDLLESNSYRFKALGHPTRLQILRLIVQGAVNGTPVGEILSAIGIPGSTLSHHLSCLADAKLVLVERAGTSLHYRADFPALHALVDYLWEDCCMAGQCGASGCAGGPGCCSEPPQEIQIARS